MLANKQGSHRSGCSGFLWDALQNVRDTWCFSFIYTTGEPFSLKCHCVRIVILDKLISTPWKRYHILSCDLYTRSHKSRLIMRCKSIDVTWSCEHNRLEVSSCYQELEDEWKVVPWITSKGRVDPGRIDKTICAHSFWLNSAVQWTLKGTRACKSWKQCPSSNANTPMILISIQLMQK